MLHVFHGFTGCDQTSVFLGQRKSMAWATWMSYGCKQNACYAGCQKCYTCAGDLQCSCMTGQACAKHTARVGYQAGHCWGECIVSNPELPSPSEWGWTRSKSDAWATLPEASKVCQELVKCGCKAEIGCKGCCRCLKAGMPCTALCKCGGDCK